MGWDESHPTHLEAPGVNSYQSVLRWSLCLAAAAAPLLLLWAALPPRFSDCVADRCPAYVTLLMDCTAWTCWRRRASSTSQASSSADVLVVSHPRTSVITSTPLFTTIWNDKGEAPFHTPRTLFWLIPCRTDEQNMTQSIRQPVIN